MNIVIGLCHVDFSNIDTFSESYLKQIVACEEEVEMTLQATICFKYDSEKVSILLKY